MWLSQNFLRFLKSWGLKMENSCFEIIAAGDVRVVLRCRERALSLKASKEVEKIWGEFQKGRDVFNGTLLDFDGIEKEEEDGKILVYGNFTNYKSFIAHLKAPGLGLNIRPISVSGFTLLEEGGERYFVFAKRQGTSTYDGYLEAVPSGSIEKDMLLPGGEIDYKNQLVKEFVEETGEPREAISSIKTLGLVLDKKGQNYDVCCLLRTNSTRGGVESSFKRSQEYSSPIFVSEGKLEKFIRDNESVLVPTSIGLVQLYLQSLGGKNE